MEPVNYILKYLGGSHAYGLNTPVSDKDVRGLFAHTDMDFILGLKRFEHQEDIKGGKDERFKELRHFFCLLQRSNSEAVEMLYLDPKSADWYGPEMYKIHSQRDKLVDSSKLYRCLSGYIVGELKLANGERVGQLGSKRKESLDKYKYSPKNFVQLFRLAWAGCVFFEKGYFPVNVKGESPGFAAFLLDIKTDPAKYSKDELNKIATAWDRKLKEAFDKRGADRNFDEKVANKLCADIYVEEILPNLDSDVLRLHAGCDGYCP